jgi:hypothetical protein
MKMTPRYKMTPLDDAEARAEFEAAARDRSELKLLLDYKNLLILELQTRHAMESLRDFLCGSAFGILLCLFGWLLS